VATPLCRHFGPCGGCDRQDIAYSDQLERKQIFLRDLLETALDEGRIAVEPVLPMRVDHTGWPWQFRHKASFVFGDAEKDRKLTIGHYAAGSRRIVPIVECPVHASRANRLAFALHSHLAKAGVSAAGPLLQGVLRHLVVRTTRDDREAVAMLVVTRNDKSLRAPVRAFLATEEAPDGFYLNVHDKPGPYMVGRQTMRLSGRSHIREQVAGISFLISPTTFFQTNVEAAETLLRLATERIPAATQRILDLYAGSGLFTVPLAARGHHVTAIEENAQAMRDAEQNLRLNRVDAGRARLHTGRVEDVLRRAGRDAYDLVILDPPRSGCGSQVLRKVFGAIRPRRAVYVSCNPEALAVELRAIVALGYGIGRIQPVDMFPHTAHIETVVSLERRASRGRSSTTPRTVG
jgi:23S rRNA (uracil1939-C5)-methyltransferase